MYRSENLFPELKEAAITETKTKPKKTGPFAKKAAALVMTATMAFAGFGFGLGAGGLLSKNRTSNENAKNYFTESAKAGDASGDVEYVSYGPSLLTSSNANVSIVDVVKKTANSIVSINVKATMTANNFFGRGSFEYETASAGSGVIFFEDETKIYILTNFHVIEGADEVTISIDDQKQAKASFVGNDKTEDLAIISVLKSELENAGITEYSVAAFGNSDMLEVGETVVAIGNAIGEGKSATAGIVSALNKSILIEGVNYNAIQTDATINPGNSGGALVNTNSEVIGINTAKISGNGVEGMGYSIPSNTVKKVIDQIMTHGSPKKPYLGIDGLSITEELLLANINLKLPGLGVYVNRVYQGSGAAAGGLRNYDLITGINGTEITTIEELTEEIQKIGVGGVASLDVYRMDNNRNFNKITIEAVIGDSNAGSGINF